MPVKRALNELRERVGKEHRRRRSIISDEDRAVMEAFVNDLLQPENMMKPLTPEEKEESRRFFEELEQEVKRKGMRT